MGSFKDFTDTEQRISHQVRESREDILTLKEQMEALQFVIQKHSEQAAEIAELYENIKALLKILSFIEKVAKWLITTAASVGLLWGIWKYLIVETLKDVAASGRIPR